ncbi:MAG: hypothetical protein Q4G25_07480 [Paracoccus sp. (in: a-proteobacteria)]|nr:hypothetical protein [Paracoccus sp. (in: a-proteobacteria)]
MTERLDWMAVAGPEGQQPAGAIGFIGETVAAIALFEAGGTAQALLDAARSRPEIRDRDAAFAMLALRPQAQFPQSVAPGAFRAGWPGAGLDVTTRGAARLIPAARISRILPRRGMEAALAQALQG